MSKMRVSLIALLLSLVGVSQLFSQRVVAYHQWFNSSKIQSWYWDNVTDVNICFLQVDAQGGVGFAPDNGVDLNNYEQNLFESFLATAKTKGKRLSISIGGASLQQAKNFRTISQSQSLSNTFATNIVNFCENYELDGIDLDWEPFSTDASSQPTVAEWDRLVKAVYDEIQTSSRSLELTAAVFPWEYNNSHVTTSCYQYFDHLNLMVYDFGGNDWIAHSQSVPNNSFTNNSKYRGWDIEAACVDYWSTVKGLSTGQMVLGLPFYGRSDYWQYDQNDFKTYRDILSADGSANTKDISSGWYYNGQSTIERKTTYALDNGLKGVMYWEWTGDGTVESTSLQKSITDAIDATGGCARPDLGDNQVICGVQDIDLSAGVSSTDYTFAWYQNGSLLSANTETYTATAPGTYRVIITSIAAGCTRESSVILEDTYGDLPALEDASLCGSAAYDADATISGFESMNYSWSDGSSTVGSSSTLSITTPGTYTVTVSDPYGHCADKTGSFTASENTVDVTVDDVCLATDEAHYVISGAGNFAWYDAQTGGNLLGNESELYRVQNAGPVWIQKTGGATNYTVGLAYDNEVQADEFSGPGTGDYSAWNSDDVRLQFDVKQNLTITQFTARVATSGDIDVVIYDENGAAVQTQTVNLEFEGLTDIQVNFELTPGRYYLGMPDAQQWTQKNPTFGEDIGYGEFGVTPGVMDLDGVIDFVASNSVEEGLTLDIVNWYAGFYDIQVSTGQVCPRVSAEASVDPAVCPQNDAPTLTFTATPSTNVIEGDVVVLEWSATDPEGDDLTIAITEGGATRSWSSPYNWTATTGSTTFEVTVSDGTNDDVVETITIDVTANQSPVVNLSSDVTSGITGDDVTFTWSATDPEGESLDVKIFLNGQEQSWSSPYTWTSTTGDHLIRVEAEDPRGGISSQEISVTITDPANESPSVDGISVNPDPADVGEDVSISVSASDNDGTVASINISVDGQDLVGPNATWTPTSDGDFTINVTVTDDDGATASDSYVITVNAVAVNQDPVINSVTASPNPAETGQTVSIAIDAVDNDGSIASIETTVDNQTLSGSNVSFTPSTAGTYTVSVVVTDDQGATDTYSTTVLVNDPSTGGTGTDGGCDDFEEAEGNGVYFAANESVFATSRSNGVYEVTVTHGSESIWAPVFANFADENGNDQSIDVSGNPTGSVVVSNPSSEVVEVYFTIRDGSGAKATADISSGSANVWGGRMGPGESMTVNFDLTQARTRSWSDGTGCAGDFVAPNHCMVNEGLDLTDITNVEWSINKGLDASPWNEALDGVTVTFDDFVFGVCPNDVVDPGNQDPVIASIDVNPNPAEVDENVSINVVASDADGTIASYSISVDGQVFNSSSATWSTSTAGTYTINVTVADNEGATATSSSSVTVEDPGNNNGGGTDMVTILSPAQGEDIENPGIITVEIEADAAVENVYVLVTYPDGTSQYKPAYDSDGDGIYNFIIVPDQNTGIGSYSMEVIARDGNGGEDRETLDFTTSGAVDFSSGPGTGIATSTVFSGVVVYPMPAVEFVNVELSTYSNGSGTAEILDMNGNVRYETEVTTSGASATTVQMSVENLNTGIYFIRLTVDGDTIVEKLIVE